MRFSARQRWLVLGALLAATLAAATWVRERTSAPGAEIVAAAESRAPAGAPAQTAADSEAPAVGLDKLESRELGKATRDPFATAPPRKATRQPRVETRPAPAAVAPPPPPSAPPLPFVYMGKLIAEGDLSIFLLQGERNLIVREGDTIDSLYRVERISDAGVTLLYLPLNQRQTIVIGEPQ